MGLIDFILNFAGLLLWLNWLSVRLDPWARRSAATLGGTLRRAGPSRARRWAFLAGLAFLLGTRAFLYWQIGAALEWTPRLNLGAVIVSFPLSHRADSFGLMLLYSSLSFAGMLAGFYFWLLLLSVLGGRGAGNDPFLQLARTYLGKVARWHWGGQLAMPAVSMAAVWLALQPVLASLELVPDAASWLHRIEQATLLGAGAYLVWKYLVVAVLALKLLHSYVYLGRHPFWEFVGTVAQRLTQPLNRLRLRVEKVDFAPLAVITLVLLFARMAESGLDLPGVDLRIPSLPEAYARLPL